MPYTWRTNRTISILNWIEKRGWKRSQKGNKKKDLLVPSTTKKQAQARWLKHLALVWANLWADLVFISAQL